MNTSTSTSSNEYHYTQKVLFQHCDPAGIVFYPRYFEMLNACVESWFDQELQFSYGTLVGELKKGVPTVTVNAEFVSPSYLEDILEFTLSVKRIGRSSLDMDVSVTCDDTARLSFSKRIVFIDSESGRSIPWPEKLKVQFNRYLAENA